MQVGEVLMVDCIKCFDWCVFSAPAAAVDSCGVRHVGGWRACLARVMCYLTTNTPAWNTAQHTLDRRFALPALTTPIHHTLGPTDHIYACMLHRLPNIAHRCLPRDSLWHVTRIPMRPQDQRAVHQG